MSNLYKLPSCSPYALEEAFQEGVSYDEQAECMELMFDPTDEELTGTDEETQEMIKMYLREHSLAPHIVSMLRSWLEDGF